MATSREGRRREESEQQLVKHSSGGEEEEEEKVLKAQLQPPPLKSACYRNRGIIDFLDNNFPLVGGASAIYSGMHRVMRK
jgi:hypothetical protein